MNPSNGDDQSPSPSPNVPENSSKDTDEKLGANLEAPSPSVGMRVSTMASDIAFEMNSNGLMQTTKLTNASQPMYLHSSQTPVKSHEGGSTITTTTEFARNGGHAGQFAVASKMIAASVLQPSPKQATLTQMGVEVLEPTRVDERGHYVLGDDPSSLDTAANKYANHDTKIVINGALAYSGDTDHPLYRKIKKEGRELWAVGGCSYVIECPGLPVNLRNGVEEHIERMADDIDHCRTIEPFSSNVIEHIKKRRARGVKYDSDEDLKDAEKMPHEFDYSSAEEKDINSESAEDKADCETPPPRKKHRSD